MAGKERTHDIHRLAVASLGEKKTANLSYSAYGTLLLAAWTNSPVSTGFADTLPVLQAHLVGEPLPFDPCLYGRVRDRVRDRVRVQKRTCRQRWATPLHVGIVWKNQCSEDMSLCYSRSCPIFGPGTLIEEGSRKMD